MVHMQVLIYGGRRRSSYLSAWAARVCRVSCWFGVFRLAAHQREATTNSNWNKCKPPGDRRELTCCCCFAWLLLLDGGDDEFGSNTLMTWITGKASRAEFSVCFRLTLTFARCYLSAHHIDQATLIIIIIIIVTYTNIIIMTNLVSISLLRQKNEL